MGDSTIHTPITPARAGHIGENVFLDEWVRLVSQDSLNGHRDMAEDLIDPLHEILGVLRVTPRRAAVAATFVKWMGCNAGLTVLDIAGRLRSLPRNIIKYPVLVAWTQENVRQWGVNGGIRFVDSVMATEGDFSRTAFGPSLSRQPVFDAEDLEVIERVCIWLGTGDGWRFVENCTWTVETTQREARRRDFLSHLNVEK